MNRQTALLASLGIVLILVLFFFFGFKPKQDELAEVREEIDTTLAQQATLQQRIDSLETVREQAPEIEAALATAESIIPREAALASSLRQLQLAADDSGVELQSVAPGRPAALDPEVPELATLSLALTLQGGYFQVVDFLRRIEDAAIVPRGIEWSSVTLARAEYPALTVGLTGEMYALIPAPTPPEPETPAPTETQTEEAGA